MPQRTDRTIAGRALLRPGALSRHDTVPLSPLFLTSEYRFLLRRRVHDMRNELKSTTEVIPEICIHSLTHWCLAGD